MTFSTVRIIVRHLGRFGVTPPLADSNIGTGDGDIPRNRRGRLVVVQSSRPLSKPTTLTNTHDENDGESDEQHRG
jgi:hypothetical protein